MRDKADLGAGHVEQLDHGRGARGEDDGIAGEFLTCVRSIAVQPSHQHALDAVMTADGAGDHRLRQNGHAPFGELRATGGIARRLSCLDQRDDLASGSQGRLG